MSELKKKYVCIKPVANYKKGDVVERTHLHIAVKKNFEEIKEGKKNTSSKSS